MVMQNIRELEYEQLLGNKEARYENCVKMAHDRPSFKVIKIRPNK